MTRDEWKKQYHDVRADARAFKREHGGHPCFSRYFNANGRNWQVIRHLSNGTAWQTDIRPSVWKTNSKGRLIALELADVRYCLNTAAMRPWRRYNLFSMARLGLEAAAAIRTS